MYITSVPNRNSPPAVLLRESYRENGKVKSRTIANLSRLPEAAVRALDMALKGKVPAAESLEVVKSFHHGHVRAVLDAMRRLGFASLVASRPSPRRDRAVALVAARIIQPRGTLAATRWWGTTTLPRSFGVEGSSEDDLRDAMDWLLERQPRIEKKLAARHLEDGAPALYNLMPGSFEGTAFPLPAFDRDGKKGKLQVACGLLTDARGTPVAVSALKGGRTLGSQIDAARRRFGLERLAVVDNSGAQAVVDALRGRGGIDWIAALRSSSVRKLLESGAPDLFDERGPFELTHPDFPGERLIAWRNAAEDRRKERDRLLEAAANELAKIRRTVAGGRLKGRDRIGLRVGRVFDRHRVSRHFRLDIEDGRFDFSIDRATVASEAALDDLRVIRTNVPSARLDAPDAVRGYGRLREADRTFPSFRTVDREAGLPCQETRIRANIFLHVLAFYMQRHMADAWRPLLFAREDRQAKKTRGPAAEPSAGATRRARTRALEDGSPAPAFHALLAELGAIVRNVCRADGMPPGGFDLDTSPDARQRRAFELLKTIGTDA